MTGAASGGSAAGVGRVGSDAVTAAAASAVVRLLLDPARVGAVLGTFPRAVLFGIDTDAGPRVVSLLAREAAGVPNGVRLTGPLPADVVAVRANTRVLVGDGGIRVGHLSVRLVRSWNSQVYRIRPDPAGLAALDRAAGAAERGVPLAAIRSLSDALAATGASTVELAAAAQALVGLGSGLTPGGDDVLSGLLIGLHAGGRTDLARRIGDRVLRGITERTTLLSADLLRLADAGQAGAEALAVLRAIHRPGPNVAKAPTAAGERLTASVQALLSVGHTSGADLATGLAMGLRFAMSAIDREDAMTAAQPGAR